MARVDSRVPVLIATWLDSRHAERIAAAEPDRIELIYEPELLPTTRYEADHHGPPRPLTEEQRLRWQKHLGRAEIAFEFDWERPEELLERAPRLRWLQATSSGIGPLVEHLGLAGSQLIITNAAGIHAQPLAEFVLLTALYFAKEMPRVNAWKAERHWERFCGREVFGSRMTLIGLGRVGSRIAELSSALGMEVTGHRRTTGGQAPAGVRKIVDSAGLDAALPETDILVNASSICSSRTCTGIWIAALSSMFSTTHGDTESAREAQFRFRWCHFRGGDAVAEGRGRGRSGGDRTDGRAPGRCRRRRDPGPRHHRRRHSLEPRRAPRGRRSIPSRQGRACDRDSALRRADDCRHRDARRARGRARRGRRGSDSASLLRAGRRFAHRTLHGRRARLRPAALFRLRVRRPQRLRREAGRDRGAAVSPAEPCRAEGVGCAVGAVGAVSDRRPQGLRRV